MKPKFGTHLFILYWGMVSYITPPVALGAFAAAPKPATDKKPAATARAKPTKAKKAKAHTATPAPAPAEGASGGN